MLETGSHGGEDDVALLALEPVQLVPERLELTMPAEPHGLGPLRRDPSALAETMRRERR